MAVPMHPSVNKEVYDYVKSTYTIFTAVDPFQGEEELFRVPNSIHSVYVTAFCTMFEEPILKGLEDGVDYENMNLLMIDHSMKNSYGYLESFVKLCPRLKVVIGDE